MNWMTKLYETYGEVKKQIEEEDNLDQTLSPPYHSFQNAHINIVIDEKGSFRKADVVPKDTPKDTENGKETTNKILIPVTESSDGRTSGEAPHPLADKLQYIAKDYPDYGGKKASYFNEYQKQLANWCQSEFSHPKVKAVYQYIQQGHVIRDLIREKIVIVDDNNQLITEWTSSDKKPELFKVLGQAKDQGDALVCWTVEMSTGDPQSKTWKDDGIQRAWCHYYSHYLNENSKNQTINQEESLCFITGEKGIEPASNYPAKLRYSGDKAKLISSNDKDGFTYLGKFTDAYQAMEIGIEAAQKAHSALRWLISKQAYRNDTQVILAWAMSGKPIPNSFQSDTPEEEELGIDHSRDLGQSFTSKLKKKLDGYRTKLKDEESILIFGLDSATPGRMSIIYYHETNAKDFFEKLESWYKAIAWPQAKQKNKSRYYWPIPSEIVNTAYFSHSRKIDNKLLNKTIERLIPCIIEGLSLPKRFSGCLSS